MGSLNIISKQLSQHHPFVASFLSPTALRAQLVYWAEELNFYHQLLSWSIFGHPETLQQALENKLDQIAVFREKALPDLIVEFESLTSSGRSVRPDLLTRFQQTGEQLKVLKQQIFQQAEGFIRIQIW